MKKIKRAAPRFGGVRQQIAHCIRSDSDTILKKRQQVKDSAWKN